MIELLSRRTIKHLLSLPNVIGMGYGMKETGGVLTDEASIVVLVSKKVPSAMLAEAECVPKQIEGVVSDVLEVGHMKPIGKSSCLCKIKKPSLKKTKKALCSRFRRRRVRPAYGGASIGHYKITAGTFGAVVYDCCSGNPLILSNNHVLANETNGKDKRAKKGDPILQPGPLDGGTVKKDTIARLCRFVPLKDKCKNRVDAAVAKPLKRSCIIPFILGVGRVNGTVLPRIGMCVQKSGRTTCLTQGRIRCIDVLIQVDYDGRLITFKNQIMVENLRESEIFSRGGDSGSLVLDKENRAVGLLFAGSDDYTLVNPINPVLDLLKVRF